MRILLFYLHYSVIFHRFHGFLSLCLPCRPWFVTPSGVDPSQASRGEWWRLFAILADGGSLNKNTLDYEIVPADGVEPSQCRAGRGMR